jgi:hypothetical protein
VPLTFDLTFDYLCPFARNAAEFVIDGLEHGADWDVTFTPYSLAQGHTEEGEPAIWEQDNHDRRSGILALQVGLAVQDRFPDAFPAAHRELFALRHDRGEDLRDRDAIRKALDAADVDPDAVFEAVAAGTYLDVLRTEHERNVEVHGVWVSRRSSRATVPCSFASWTVPATAPPRSSGSNGLSTWSPTSTTSTSSSR